MSLRRAFAFISICLLLLSAQIDVGEHGISLKTIELANATDPSGEGSDRQGGGTQAKPERIRTNGPISLQQYNELVDKIESGVRISVYTDKSASISVTDVYNIFGKYDPKLALRLINLYLQSDWSSKSSLMRLIRKMKKILVKISQKKKIAEKIGGKAQVKILDRMEWNIQGEISGLERALQDILIEENN